MNSKLNKILAISLITAMALSIIPVFAQPSEPHAASTIWLEPSSLSGPYGTVFQVVCWANVAEDGFTFQVEVFWDDTIFQLNSMLHTPGMPLPIEDWLDQRTPGASATTLTGPIIGAGNALIGGTCMGDDFVPSETVGSLFVAEFEVIGAPPKGGTIDTWIDIDDPDTYILNPDLDEVAADKLGSHYDQDWVLPPSPRLAVLGGNFDPHTWTFGPDPPSAIGTTFDAEIYVLDLDAGWWLHNATLHLGFDDTLITMTGVVFDPLWGNWLWGLLPGDLTIEAKDPTSPPAGDVLVATVTFEVISQCDSPPRPGGDHDDSPLDINNYELWDTSIEIPTDPEEDGLVKIYCLREVGLPYLEVSNATMGWCGEDVVGEEFDVNVTLKDLDVAWRLIGIEFRLSYNATLIEPVDCTEGPFLPGFAALQPGSLGTWYECYFEPNGGYGPHVLVGDLILPNATGWWHEPYPEGEGLIATIRFKVLMQLMGEELTCGLDIIAQLGVGLDDPVLQNPVDVTMGVPINGTYTISGAWPGRVIDVYGGALNEGYGSHPFPPPYGGQGPNNPMDLVVPQSEVCLYANVTYNFWPVQQKIVSFEVEYPEGYPEDVFLKRTAVTDDCGVAYICFEMPWICDDPESLFGVWTVTVTVSISDVRVNDTLQFHYDYLVRYWKVTTDKLEYCHSEDVEITIEYGTHAQQWYPVLLSVVLMDELIVPFGITWIETEVGGAEFCMYTNFTAILSVHVPKHAFAGVATVHVNAFDKDPTEGGIAWSREYAPPPRICILPCPLPC